MRSVDRDVFDTLLGLGALEAVEVPVGQAADGDQGLAHHARELVLHVAGNGAAQGVQEDEEGGEVHPAARGRRGRRLLAARGRRRRRLLAGSRRLFRPAVSRTTPRPGLPRTCVVVSPVHLLPWRRTPRERRLRSAPRWWSKAPSP